MRRTPAPRQPANAARTRKFARQARRRAENALIATYLYNTDNRRLRKSVSNRGLAGGLTDGATDFYYDGWRVMEERMPDSEPGTDVLMRQYTYGNYLDEVWTVDRRYYKDDLILISDLNDGACYDGYADRLFCHANTLYSVCGLTDETGALREAYQYGPYGAPTRIADGPDGDLEVNFGADDVRAPAAPSSFENPFLFTGQRLDPETGLLFYKNRYYSPPLGRFLSRDPLMTVRAGWRDYIYCFDILTRYKDPLGLFIELIRGAPKGVEDVIRSTTFEGKLPTGVEGIKIIAYENRITHGGTYDQKIACQQYCSKRQANAGGIYLESCRFRIIEIQMGYRIYGLYSRMGLSDTKLRDLLDWFKLEQDDKGEWHMSFDIPKGWDLADLGGAATKTNKTGSPQIECWRQRPNSRAHGDVAVAFFGADPRKGFDLGFIMTAGNSPAPKSYEWETKSLLGWMKKKEE